MSTTATTVRRFAIRGAALLAGAAFVSDAGAQEVDPAPEPPRVLYACYVPASGTVYRIKEPGLRSECVGNHVAFSWNESGPAGPKGDPGPQGTPGLSGYQILEMTHLQEFDQLPKLEGRDSRCTQWLPDDGNPRTIEPCMAYEYLYGYTGAVAEREDRLVSCPDGKRIIYATANRVTLRGAGWLIEMQKVTSGHQSDPTPVWAKTIDEAREMIGPPVMPAPLQYNIVVVCVYVADAP